MFLLVLEIVKLLPRGSNRLLGSSKMNTGQHFMQVRGVKVHAEVKSSCRGQSSCKGHNYVLLKNYCQSSCNGQYCSQVIENNVKLFLMP